MSSGDLSSKTEVSCETQGHLWGWNDLCVMCKTPKPAERPLSKPVVDFPIQLRDLARRHEAFGFTPAERAGLMAAADEIDRLTAERDEALAALSHCQCGLPTIREIERLTAERDKLVEQQARAGRHALRVENQRMRAAGQGILNQLDKRSVIYSHDDEVLNPLRVALAGAAACICRYGEGPQEDCPVHGRLAGAADEPTVRTCGVHQTAAGGRFCTHCGTEVGQKP